MPLVSTGDEETAGVGNASDAGGSGEAVTRLYDLRVVVERIEGRSVCGLAVGDFVELRNSSQLTIPAGKHFCLYALAAITPLLPVLQRPTPDGDWLQDGIEAACPDAAERLIMRITRTGVSTQRRADLE